MARTVDVRDFNAGRLTESRVNELRSTAAQPGLTGGPKLTIARFDNFTGNPTLVRVEPAPEQGAGLEGNISLVQRAVSFMQSNSAVFGLAPSQPPEFEPYPVEQRLSSNAAAVHLQQKYKGIPIFQAQQAVRFTPAGALVEVAGNTVTVVEDQEATPTISAERAVQLAAQHLVEPDPDEAEATDPYGQPRNPPTIDLASFAPKVVAAFSNTPERNTAFESGASASQITASLIWFPLAESLRLAWAVTIAFADGQDYFLTLVDAQDGGILYSRDLTQAIAARGSVYVNSPEQNRRMTHFPQPWNTYNLPVPADLQTRSPDDWIDATSTDGISARAHLAPGGPSLNGSLQDGVVTFNPGDRFGDEQRILNAFYFCCCMHDIYYLLGFREQNGNFQRGNTLNTSADPVDVQVFPGPIDKTASFVTPPDGSTPTMRLGLVTASNRHTALDITVVFHEYTHGLTNRLVGGPGNAMTMLEPQSSGMGEGFSDYAACTLTGANVIGAWLVNQAGGIRKFRYDTSFPANTDHFGKLGSGRYTGEHAIGEIWCATLMEINRNLLSALGDPAGLRFALQLVVDALKLSPPNPSFLDMRDAILAALANTRASGILNSADHTKVYKGVWSAFAKFGMGPDASSNGASLFGIVADFNIPRDVQGGQPAAPVEQIISRQNTAAIPIPDNNPAGTASTITIAQQGVVRAVKVAVRISHTYIGDLQIGLVAPSGRFAFLQDRKGDDQVDLEAVFDRTNTTSLASLVGEHAQGDWLLGVRDLAAKDSGKLEQWTLEVTVGNAGGGQ